jgi:hypothetical protein
MAATLSGLPSSIRRVSSDEVADSNPRLRDRESAGRDDGGGDDQDSERLQRPWHLSCANCRRVCCHHERTQSTKLDEQRVVRRRHGGARSRSSRSAAIAALRPATSATLDRAHDRALTMVMVSSTRWAKLQRGGRHARLAQPPATPPGRVAVWRSRWPTRPHLIPLRSSVSAA